MRLEPRGEKIPEIFEIHPTLTTRVAKKYFTLWEPRFLGQYFAQDSVIRGPTGALKKFLIEQDDSLQKSTFF